MQWRRRQWRWLEAARGRWWLPWATHREACEAVEVGRVRVLVHVTAEQEADRGEEAQQLQRGHVDYGLAHRGAVPARGCTGLYGAQFGGVCACECSGVFWTEARVPRTDACAQDRCACGGVLHGVARRPVARACVCVRACARARACSGAARMKSAQTATVASSCIETSAKTLRRKPGQPERSNSVSPASK